MKQEHNQKEQARNLYINEGMMQTEIADTLGIDRKTIYRWIKSGQWEETRITRSQSPADLGQSMYNHITAINERIARRGPFNRIPTMEETTMLCRLMDNARKTGRLHVGGYYQAYDELIKNIAAYNEELARSVAVHAEQYLKSMYPSQDFVLMELPPLTEDELAAEERRDKISSIPEVARLKGLRGQEKLSLLSLIFHKHNIIIEEPDLLGETESITTNEPIPALPKNSNTPGFYQNYQDALKDKTIVPNTILPKPNAHPHQEETALPALDQPAECPMPHENDEMGHFEPATSLTSVPTKKPEECPMPHENDEMGHFEPAASLTSMPAGKPQECPMPHENDKMGHFKPAISLPSKPAEKLQECPIPHENGKMGNLKKPTSCFHNSFRLSTNDFRLKKPHSPRKWQNGEFKNTLFFGIWNF
jgi:DNA-binding MarR family transcriptional regulator